MPEVRRTFSISLDSEALDQLDMVAEVEKRSRNSLLEKIITDWLKREFAIMKESQDGEKWKN